MSGLLLDTNHASLLFRDDPRLTKKASLLPTAFYVCRPSVGELWFMMYNSGRVPENVRKMTRFLRAFAHLEFDAAAAIRFGQIKTDLRRRGRMIGNIDIQIAAIALVHDLTLLTHDRDFDNIADLRRDDWLR